MNKYNNNININIVRYTEIRIKNCHCSIEIK